MYASASFDWPFIFMAQHRRHRRGPPPWVTHMMGGTGGAEKGEIRYLILDALRDGPAHGYGIIGIIEKRSGGGYRPSPGSIYPTLQMLEEMGHVEVTDQEGKKLYALTDAGRADLEAHADEVEEAYDRISGDADWFDVVDLHELGARFGRLMRGIGRGVRSGRIGKKELREISDAIDEAASKIEEVLRASRR